MEQLEKTIEEVKMKNSESEKAKDTEDKSRTEECDASGDVTSANISKDVTGDTNISKDVTGDTNISKDVTGDTNISKDDTKDCDESGSEYNSCSSDNEGLEGLDDAVDDFHIAKDETDEKSDKDDDDVDEEYMKELEAGFSEDKLQELYEEAVSLKSSGNFKFQNKEHLEAKDCYTAALKICPLKHSKYRAVLYANRAACKVYLEEDKSAVSDCSKAIKLEPGYVKALVRRAQLNEKLDNLDEALADYQEILKHESSHQQALYAAQRLPPMINERNEKMKTEMLGKLKDLGNMVLRPFGLSTENFQVNQDPNSGGYSINFNQNKS